MRRGTTPTITAKIKEMPELEVINAVMLIRQGDVLITKSTAIEDNMAKVELTQEETYSLVAERKVLLQLKLTVRDDSEQGFKVIRSDITGVMIEDALDDEVVSALDDEVTDDGGSV